MPVSRGTDIIPFKDESMRLLRETWANPTMLAEELFAIFQQKIPQNTNGPLNVNIGYGFLGSAITISNFGDGPFFRLKDRNGEVVAEIDQDGRFNKLSDRDSQNNSGTFTRIKPRIVWENPADMNDGDVLGASQLNATAVHPITGTSVAGVFVYSPASATVMSTGDGQMLRTTFTPTDMVVYRIAKASVHVDVVDPAVHIEEIGLGSAVSYEELSNTVSTANWVGKNASGDVLPGTITIVTPDLAFIPTDATPVPYSVNFDPDDMVTYTSANLTGNITVVDAEYSGNGICTDNSLGGDAIQVTISAVTGNSTVAPGGTGESVVAENNGSSDLPPNGAEVGLTYDYATETWLYSYSSS